MESDNNLRIINPFGKNWEEIDKEIKEKSILEILRLMKKRILYQKQMMI